MRFGRSQVFGVSEMYWAAVTGFNLSHRYDGVLRGIVSMSLNCKSQSLRYVYVSTPNRMFIIICRAYK